MTTEMKVQFLVDCAIPTDRKVGILHEIGNYAPKDTKVYISVMEDETLSFGTDQNGLPMGDVLADLQELGEALEKGLIKRID